MEAQLEPPAEEIKRLRRSINDLVSVVALPAIWGGGEPAEIVRALIEVLLGILHLDLIYVRMEVAVGEAPIETVRVARRGSLKAGPREIRELCDRWLGDDLQKWPPLARNTIGDAELTIVPLRLGLQGEMGVIVAGSRRGDFPRQTEQLVLSVAANQAAIGLQQARLLSEQRRVANELDERVAQRTSDLAAANETLKKEVAERQRAEEALRESERESRLIVDSIPGLVALLAASGEVEVVNRRVFEYFGQTLEELRQWGTNGTIHPEDLPHVIEVFTRSIAGGSPYEIVQRFRRSDGLYRWFQNSGFPLHDPDGRIVRWCVLLTDIDEHKRAEDALRASEHNLKLIIDTIPALAWSARPDGTAEFFSQHYLDFVGLAGEGPSGWGWTSAVHSDDLKGLAATWQRVMASEAPGEAEARLRRHDGEYRWFLFRVNPLRDDKGNIVKWYGINTDIEDRKRAEAELSQAYGRLAEAQRVSRTGSFTADIVADDHVWSEELYRIFEIEPATNVTVQAIRDAVHPEDLPTFDAAFERSAGGADFDLVFRIVTQSGNAKHVHCVAHVIEQTAGRPVFIGAIQDVTESKAAEVALNKARSELAHVARVTSLGALTASIAHEVNQPLSGIVTNASTCLRMLAADPPNVDGARETARRTIRDGHRASDVITRLRALFTKKDAATETVDLNEATREVIALSLSGLQRNRVILRTELAGDLPPVTGDRVQLQQVILNLLLNASDAMSGVEDRPRQVVIRTERDEGERVRLSVQDAGVGFDPQAVDRLFESFYTTKSDGMGIGLSVSRSIIESHHGRLCATPNDGPGATFSFSIPCGDGRTNTKVQ